MSTSSERVPDLGDAKGKEATPNAVEEAERAPCYTLEGDSATLSEMVHGLSRVSPKQVKKLRLLTVALQSIIAKESSSWLQTR